MARCRGSPSPNISPARGIRPWGRWLPNVKPRGAVEGKGRLHAPPTRAQVVGPKGPPLSRRRPILKSWCNGNPAPPLLYTLFYRGLVLFGSSDISQTPLNPTPPRKKRGGQIWVQDDFSSSRNSRLAATQGSERWIARGRLLLPAVPSCHPRIAQAPGSIVASRVPSFCGVLTQSCVPGGEPPCAR